MANRFFHNALQNNYCTRGSDHQAVAKPLPACGILFSIRHLGAVVALVGAKTGVSVTRHLGFTDYLCSRLVEIASIEAKRVRHLMQFHDRCTGHDELLI